MDWDNSIHSIIISSGFMIVAFSVGGRTVGFLSSLYTVHFMFRVAFLVEHIIASGYGPFSTSRYIIGGSGMIVLAEHAFCSDFLISCGFSS